MSQMPLYHIPRRLPRLVTTCVSRSRDLSYLALRSLLSLPFPHPPHLIPPCQPECSSLTSTYKKVSHYVPAVKKVLRGSENAEEKEPSRSAEAVRKNMGPPNRPEHDPQIGEFIRDQHKSIPVTDLEE